MGDKVSDQEFSRRNQDRSNEGITTCNLTPLRGLDDKPPSQYRGGGAPFENNVVRTAGSDDLVAAVEIAEEDADGGHILGTIPTTTNCELPRSHDYDESSLPRQQHQQQPAEDLQQNEQAEQLFRPTAVVLPATNKTYMGDVTHKSKIVITANDNGKGAGSELEAQQEGERERLQDDDDDPHRRVQQEPRPQQEHDRTKKKNKRKLKGRKREGMTREEELSRSLSWVLRHSAPSLKLSMSSDGYVPVSQVLRCHPRFKSFTFDDVRRVVERNDKQRFKLVFRKPADDDTSGVTTSSRPADGGRQGGDCASIGVQGEDEARVVVSPATGVGGQGENEIEGAQSSSSLSRTRTDAVRQNAERMTTKEEWYIRANQGHSFKNAVLDDTRLLRLLSSEDVRCWDTPIVHGTSKMAWERFIQQGGLNRMKRRHIHFATGLPSASQRITDSNGDKGKESERGGEGCPPLCPVTTEALSTKTHGKKDDRNCNLQDHRSSSKTTQKRGGVISGMRQCSEIYIYLDKLKCETSIRDGTLRFYRSDNGVILTPGIDGALPSSYFEKVVDARTEAVLFTNRPELRS